MQSKISNQRVTDVALDIAWGLWSDLGVSGWEASGRVEAVDIEPLILVTAWLGGHDSRLWEESLDWCFIRFWRAERVARMGITEAT